MLFKVLGKIERRLREKALLEQEDGDQNPAQTPVSVKEGMEELKLRVDQRKPHYRLFVRMIILLPVAETIGQRRPFGRRKSYLFHTTNAGTDVVLLLAKFARRLILTANTLQQNAMKVQKKIKVERADFQLLHRSVQCHSIVENFFDVLATRLPFRYLSSFKLE